MDETKPASPDSGSTIPPRDEVGSVMLNRPARLDRDDGECWICGGPVVYQHCKIVCHNCGFTRDCSDP